MTPNKYGPLSHAQGEVYIRGKKRDGLISDDEISGLRIGLVVLFFVHRCCSLSKILLA